MNISKQNIIGKAGCFHLMLLLIIIIFSAYAYYWYSQRTYGQNDTTKIQNLANQICEHKLPKIFKPLSGGDFIIFRYAVFNYKENGNEKAKIFVVSSSDDNLRNIIYFKLRSKFSNKETQVKKSIPMVSGIGYGTNKIRRCEDTLSLSGTNQTIKAFEAWFRQPKHKVVAWFAANDNKLNTMGRTFIKSVKPADSHLLEKNELERNVLSFFGSILIWIGGIAVIFGCIAMLIVAFREGIWWGLGMIFLPLVWPFFLIIHWKKTYMPFWAILFGNIVYIIGIIFETLS